MTVRRVALEETVRSRPARVDDALGDALVVEVRDLLAQDEVLEQRGTAQPRLERALVVADGNALVRGEDLPPGIDAHPVERSRVAIDAGHRLVAARLRRG